MLQSTIGYFYIRFPDMVSGFSRFHLSGSFSLVDLYFVALVRSMIFSGGFSGSRTQILIGSTQPTQVAVGANVAATASIENILSSLRCEKV